MKPGNSNWVTQTMHSWHKLGSINTLRASKNHLRLIKQGRVTDQIQVRDGRSQEGAGARTKAQTADKPNKDKPG